MIALLLRSASKTGEPALLEEDEMDYSLKLNKELPPDIRVLAWCTVPADFSARHAFTLPCPLWVCLCLTCLLRDNSQVTTVLLKFAADASLTVHADCLHDLSTFHS